MKIKHTNSVALHITCLSQSRIIHTFQSHEQAEKLLMKKVYVAEEVSG